MQFHIPTLFAVIVAVSAVYALVIAFIARHQHRGMQVWAAALGLQTTAYVLFALRGPVPEVVSVLAGNAALSSALALFGHGVLAFREQHWHRAWIWAPVFILMAVLMYWMDDFKTRMVMASAIYSAQCLLVILAMGYRRSTPMQHGEKLIAWGAGAIAVVMLYRVWAVGTGQIVVLFLADGGWFQGLTFLTMVTSTALVALGLVIMYQERAEATLQASEQSQAFRNRVLEMLAQGLPLKDILSAIVRGVEAMHPKMICSVLLLDRQGKHLHVGAAPSLPGFYNAAVEGLQIGLGHGSCGTAAFTRQRTVVDDINTHPYWAPYVEITRKAGLGSCWSQPIFSTGQRVLGTFAIYHTEPHTPSADDIALIEELSVLAGIAIERSTAASQLLESERHYRLLIETANDGIAVFQDGLLRFGNPKLFDMVGYPPEALVDRPFETLVHEEDRERALEQYRIRLAGGQVEPHQTFRVLTGHKGVRWFEVKGARFEWQGQPATLSFMTDVTERREMETRIQQQALHDSLTELPNRRLLMNNLNLAMAGHRRNKLLGALMFLDLDNFKPLNDAHGHRVGDLLLLEVARRLKSHVRETDTVARFGGDEFVVLLGHLQADPQASTEQAMAVAQKLRLALSEPYVLNAAPDNAAPRMVEHSCTASIGVVLFDGTRDEAEDLLKRADTAMYQAKQAGRNTVHLGSRPDIFTPRA
jgi:diguanylate cyclase (GGDEF)-like protein/PAS domain S-box-containing protein